MRTEAVLAAAAALTLLAASPAEAKQGGKKKPKAPAVVTRTATVATTANGQLATAVARCPKGTLAVGGGFTSPVSRGVSGVTDFNVIYESRRSGTKAWVVAAGRSDSGVAGPNLTVTASVQCRYPKLTRSKKTGKKRKKQLSVLEVKATGVSGGNMETVTATSVCPSTRRLLGGGFSVAPAPNLGTPTSFPVVLQSSPIGLASWQSSALNIGTVSRTATSYAYCVRGGKAPVVSAATAELPGGTANPEATALAPVCPGKRKLVGGGFSNPSAASQVAVPTASAQSGGARAASAFNLGSEPGTLSSTGICL